MDPHEHTPDRHTTPRARRRRPLTALSMGLATLLLATACGTGAEDRPEDASSPASSPASSAPADAGASASGQQPAEESSQAPAEPAEVGDGVGEPEALEGVSFEQAEDGTPKVTVDGEISTDQPTMRVLSTGEGEQIREGDVVQLSAAMVDPKTGEVQEETFTKERTNVAVDEALAQQAPELRDLLASLKPGAVFAMYQPEQEMEVPGTPSSESPSPSPSKTTTPEGLYVYKVEGVLPRTAEGAEVTERDERLPEVSVDEKTQEPSIGKPEGEAPDELVVQPLIQGEGREVTAEDQVTVQYQGVKWSDGETFDSSWERGAPATFALDGVVEGWKEGLSGQKVGSRVLLSVPADKAYGAEGTPDGSIGKDEDLLFVVDILDAQPAPQAQDAPQG